MAIIVLLIFAPPSYSQDIAPTATETPTLAFTPTLTATVTGIPTASATASLAPTATLTASASATATATETPILTATANAAYQTANLMAAVASTGTVYYRSASDVPQLINRVDEANNDTANTYVIFLTSGTYTFTPQTLSPTSATAFSYMPIYGHVVLVGNDSYIDDVHPDQLLTSRDGWRNWCAMQKVFNTTFSTSRLMQI